MSRLPEPGKDSGNWGDILNDYLLQSHTTDGSLKGTGQANGLATLDGGGILPNSQLPARLSDATLAASTATIVNDILDGSDFPAQVSAAASSASAASTSATNAATSATNASGFATNAGNSATAAANSVTTASGHATTAGTAATNAATARTDAETAKTAAEAAKTASETARNETIIAVTDLGDRTGAVSLTQLQTRSTYLKTRLTGNAVITPAVGIAGQAYSCTLEIQQDATGSRTVTLVNVGTSYGVTIPLSSAANAVDLIHLLWNGTVWRAFLAGTQLSVPASWAV